MGAWFQSPSVPPLALSSFVYWIGFTGVYIIHSHIHLS